MSSPTTFAQIQYARLLDVELMHGYYAQGYCPLVQLEPTPETAQTLRGYRLLYKRTPKGGGIVGEVPATVALPDNGAPMALDFYLYMRDAAFLAVTALDAAVGSGVYVYEFIGGVWTPASGHRVPMAAPAGVVAVLRLQVALAAGQPQQVTLSLAAPEVTWRYYVVTGPDYPAALQIAENGRVVSTTVPDNAEELALVQGRYPDKKITMLGVRLLLKRDLPPWYLVVDGAHAGTSHVPDVPPLPKPRPGAAPHVILDYSAILK